MVPLKVDLKGLKIDAVTVFTSDRAEIRRTIKVDLKTGKNEIDIINLPHSLEGESIRVGGIGKVVIFDLVCSMPAASLRGHGRIDQLSYLLKRAQTLSSEKTILEEQVALLQDYAKTMSAQAPDSTAFVEFLAVYGKKRKEYFEGIQEREESLRRLKDDIEDVQYARDDKTSVSIGALASADGPAEISFTYVVSGASWTPLYNIHATVANDSQTLPQIALHYRATISQDTGEDWMNVTLTLSTAAPLLSNVIPTIRTRRVMPDFPYVNGARSIQTPMSYSGEAKLHGKDAAAADEGVSFVVKGMSNNIPSSRSQAYKVSIDVIDLDGALDWVSVPREMPSAFMQCQVKNTSPYVFLPGESSVFLNNNFIATSAIPYVRPQECFSCSLGVDTAVQVIYHPLYQKPEKARSPSPGAKMDVSTFTQQITLRNTRRNYIARLILKDQLPVSADNSVRVNLREPRELLTATAGSTSPIKGLLNTEMEPVYVTGTKGLRVAWARKGADESAQGGDAQTVIHWICEMGAGSKLDLNLSWEVVRPKGMAFKTVSSDYQS